MKSLLILRHADATATGAGSLDELRPLSDLGRAQARNLGLVLNARGVIPDRVECSAAVRAVATAQGVCEAAGWATQVAAFEHLYTAPADVLLEQARKQGSEVTQLLLVAHAPGVADLVSMLTTRQNDLDQYCAAATLAEVILDVERWADARAGTGALQMLLPPQS
jgi:phosphohistidine phosphatase